jgi:hypothetical protein
MSAITIVLPFALPPAELAPDLLRALALPALAMLLARGERKPLHGAAAGADVTMHADLDEGFARALPHETWLGRRFGLNATAGSSPAIATTLMTALKMAPAEGFWFILNPVHLHIARDHLVLTDPRGLAISDTASMELFTAALPSFEEIGLSLRYGRADCWFVRADGWRDLVTATPDATCGHNIDIWMPQGASARAWRKLQNIVQMDWHAHPVNAVRAADGLQPVNSLWLWGGSDAVLHPAIQTDLAIAGFDSWFAAFAALAAATVKADAAQSLMNGNMPQVLLLRDELISPALAGDWSSWLDGMRGLEAAWFAPLLAGLRGGQVDSLQLLLGHATALQSWSVRRSSLRRFWRAPSLSGLRTETLAPEASA